MTAPPTLHRDNRPSAPEPPARLQVSFTQVVATALAAITATIVASFFGVAGTVIGAAISSVMSVVGTAVYSHSLRRTRERVREVVPVAVRRVPRPPNFPPTQGRARAPQPTYAPPYPEPHGSTALGFGPVSYSRPKPPTRRRSLGTRIAVGSAALFVAILAVITGIEALAQRPLSDLVRGNDAVSGTTLFGSRQHSSGPAHSSPTQPSGKPTVTQTVTRTNSSAPSTPAATHSTSPRPTPSSSSSVPTPSPSSTSTAGETGGAGGSAAGGAAASPATANRGGGTAPLG
jgi:hypothetical protein